MRDFSSAHPGVLFAPVIDEGEFSYRTVNVANQDRNPTSLLNWMRKVIAIRKQVKAFGRGSFSILDVDNPHIFAFERKYGNEHVLCVFNFSQSMQSVGIPLKVTERRNVRDMIGGSTLHDARARGKYQLTTRTARLRLALRELTPVDARMASQRGPASALVCR